MTTEEFYVELGKIDGWFLIPGPAEFTGKDDDTPVRLRTNIDGKTYCPITAVNKRKNKEHRDTWEWREAAKKIGLEDSRDVANAADSIFGNPKIRSSMLSITKPIIKEPV